MSIPVAVWGALMRSMELPIPVKALLMKEGHRFMHLHFPNPKTVEYRKVFKIQVEKSRVNWHKWRLAWPVPIPVPVVEHYTETKTYTVVIMGPSLDEVRRDLEKSGLKRAIVFSVRAGVDDYSVFLVTCCDDPDCPVCSNVDGVYFLRQGG